MVKSQAKTRAARHYVEPLAPYHREKPSHFEHPLGGEGDVVDPAYLSAQIAEAFAEARRREAVLLFDEVDSLLFDRTTARTTWEIGQVNELLSWLDRHPLPVVAATNCQDRLDPATLRRFVFKIGLRPLGREKALRAFEMFFGVAAPTELGSVRNLTPGDFAVVARQARLLGALDPHELVERLRCEAACKPGAAAPMGF